MRVRACVRVHAHGRAPECSEEGGRDREREREKDREREGREREGEIWKGAIERINRRDRELAS